MTKLQLENFFNTTLQNNVWDSSSWEIELQLLKEPKSDFGYLIVDYWTPEQEEIFYHRKDWTSIFTYWINRSNPKEHDIGSNVMLNDTAWIFNYITSLLPDHFFIYKTSATTCYVKWWKIFDEWEFKVVEDNSNISLAEWTNYVYVDWTELKTVTTKQSWQLYVAEIKVNSEWEITSFETYNVIWLWWPQWSKWDKGDKWDKWDKGDKGDPGEDGTDWEWVPAWWTTWQLLAKKSDNDYDVEWKDVEEWTSTAEDTTVNTDNFNKNLSSNEDTVQKALDKLDDLEVSSTAADTSVDTTNFDQNLSDSDDTVQKALQTINDLDVAWTALPEYTLSNVTEDREFDADDYTTDELADVLWTLINDAQNGLKGAKWDPWTDWEDWVWVVEWWTTGQVLTKKSDDNYDTEWTDVAQWWHTIQEEWTDLTARTKLNFVWDAITATDDESNDTTIVTVDISSKEDAFDKNTAFNKNFGTEADTVLEWNTNVWIVWTKEVDETDIADGKILKYDNNAGKLKYVDESGWGWWDGNTTPIISWAIAGEQVVGTVLEIPVAADITATTFRISLWSRPEWDDTFIVDLYLNWSGEGTSTITSDTEATNWLYQTTNTNDLESGSYSAGDVLKVAITQVGEDTPWSDFTFSLI